MNRVECLERAKEIVSKDRQNAYGSPEQNFGYIAEYWTTYLHSKGIIGELRDYDVAAMMNLLKVARIASSPDHEDNWVDGCGYLGNGIECVSKAKEREKAKIGSTNVRPEALKIFDVYNIADKAEVANVKRTL